MFRLTVHGAHLLHRISAIWTFFLAFLLVADIVGRGAFGHPVPGTKEIVQNSIVMIVFLQLPLAIYSKGMLRTTLLIDVVPTFLQKTFKTIASLLACSLFLALVWGTLPSFLEALRIGEYEGEGSLRVPTWPVRGTIGVMSAVAVFVYAHMILLDWRGKTGVNNESYDNA